MGIKIVIVVALFYSLISVHSGLAKDGAVGISGFNSNFPPSQNCHHIKDFGKIGDFYAASNPESEYGCGRVIYVQCNHKPYCNNADNWLPITIVDRCIPPFCPKKNDLILSKRAFDTLANTKETTIETQIHLG